jgi:hypothetical protein
MNEKKSNLIEMLDLNRVDAAHIDSVVDIVFDLHLLNGKGYYFIINRLDNIILNELDQYRCRP